MEIARIIGERDDDSAELVGHAPEDGKCGQREPTTGPTGGGGSASELAILLAEMDSLGQEIMADPYLLLPSGMDRT